jgi:hypothetical protein
LAPRAPAPCWEHLARWNTIRWNKAS